jgi:hypothetical protein
MQITIERETLQATLRALEQYTTPATDLSGRPCRKPIDESLCIALRAALAAQPAEPVAWRPCVNCGCDSTGKMTHCYGCPNDPATFKAPPAPAAVPLTDEQIDAIADSLVPDDFGGQIDWHRRYARAILAAAGDKT